MVYDILWDYLVDIAMVLISLIICWYQVECKRIFNSQWMLTEAISPEKENDRINFVGKGV